MVPLGWSYVAGHNEQAVPSKRDRGNGEAGHSVSRASCSLDDVFVSPVRQGDPSECEATRQPHIPVRCFVELVRADATQGADTMTTRSGPGHGQPGLVAQQGGVTVTVFAFEIAGDRIRRIWVVRNPDKLRPWMTG